MPTFRTFFLLPFILVPTFAAADLASDGLKPHLASIQGQPDRALEAGFVQTLSAIETVLQTQFRYDLGRQMTAFPILRLNRGVRNPNPETASADVLRQIVTRLLSDLEDSRKTLAHSQGSDQVFRLELNDLWLDIDGDGQRSAAENAIDLLAPVLLSRQQQMELNGNRDALAGTHIDFDMSDQAWLMAYTHVLSGMGELFLAFDPTEIIRSLETREKEVFDRLLSMPPERRAALDQELADLTQQIADETAKLRAVSDLQSDIGQRFRDLPDNATDDMRQALETEREQSRQQVRSIRANREELTERQRELAQLLAFSNPHDNTPADRLRRPDEISLKPAADFIYVLTEALAQTPDPDHIRAAHRHWLATIEHNKRFWASVAAETDDSAEWIPNSAQTGAIIQDVPDELRDAWIDILSDAEKVLNGDLLIPHFLLPSTHGINLAHYVESPSNLEIIPWLHGAGAYDYVKEGPRISDQNWRSFSRLVRGHAASFALFFN